MHPQFKQLEKAFRDLDPEIAFNEGARYRKTGPIRTSIRLFTKKEKQDALNTCAMNPELK
jgi:hypothetical protein